MISRDGFRRFLEIGVLLSFCFAVTTAEARSYHGEVRHWTRSRQMFSNTDMTLQARIHATYFSPELRQKYIQKHIQKKYLEPVEAARYTAEQQQMQDRYHEFFVGLYTPKPYIPFEMGKGSFWEMVLVTADGEMVRPVGIEQIDKTPYEHNMFPYLDRWNKAYRVLYPKAELGESFSLTLRSVVGATDLKWKQ